MANNGESADNGNSGAEIRNETTPKARQEMNTQAAGKKSRRGRYPDMQSAPRFPIKLPVTVERNLGQPREGEANGDGRFIRVIVADTQAIFRAGLRKIFALEDDIRVVGQSETMAQTLSAAKKFSADILILESALSSNPA